MGKSLVFETSTRSIVNIPEFPAAIHVMLFIGLVAAVAMLTAHRGRSRQSNNVRNQTEKRSRLG